MRKKVCTLLTAFTLTLASSMTAFAAPEVMPDGGVFDAEYYAQNNPDVVAAFGTDKELLYSHYVNCGKAEGRLGFQITADMYTTCPVASQKTLELLATGGTEGVHYIRPSKVNPHMKEYRLGGSESGWDNWSEELLLERTDFPDGLIDLDGNGLDDRDPINSLGFIDLNMNGMDDRSVGVWDKTDLEKNPTNKEEHWTTGTSYMCEHGVVCKSKVSPKLCVQCEAIEEQERIVAARRYSGHVSEDVGYKIGDTKTFTSMNGEVVTVTYQGKDRWVEADGTVWHAYLDKYEQFRMGTVFS